MNKDKTLVILLHLILWVIALFAIAGLWDTWMLDGPHGQYRWVGMDFAPYWVGVHEMLHGVNPYGPETLLKIQEMVYGGPALGKDPMMFVYPAWVFITIAPFSLIPYKWAVIIYAGSLLWAMFIFLYKIASVLGSRNLLTQSLWNILLVLGSLPFIVISVTKGQLGYFSLLALFAAHQISKRRPILAGGILGFALIKPTVTIIPVAGFLVWALLKKDWKLITGFTAVMSILLTTSFLAIGNWIPEYLETMAIKGGMPVLWSIEILSPPWNNLFVSFFIGIGIFLFYYSLKTKREYWFSASILVGIALTPMRWIYDLFFSILILTERRDFSLQQSVMAGVAILSHWFLVLIPEKIRWKTAIISLPLIWAATLLVFVIIDTLKEKKYAGV